MTQPVMHERTGPPTADEVPPFAEERRSFSVVEWRGSGPRSLHIHHADDEAWHVLEGTLRFRFADREMDVPAGGTMYVPAGVAHTYRSIGARYLLVLTPRLARLIADLKRSADYRDYPAIFARYESTMLEPGA